MSAFQVSPEHIGAMLRSAIALGRRDRDPFSYEYGATRVRTRIEDNLERVGQLLWDENARSIRARYADADDRDIPALEHDWSWYVRYGRTPTPVETLSIASCYRYQACETGDFETTEAGAFFDALRETAIRHLDGYDAAPWAWPEAAGGCA